MFKVLISLISLTFTTLLGVMGIATTCNNPLLKTFGFTSFSTPQASSNLLYCKSLMDAQSCCSDTVINNFQAQANDLTARLTQIVIARDQFLITMRTKVIGKLQSSLNKLKDASEKAMAVIKGSSNSTNNNGTKPVNSTDNNSTKPANSTNNNGTNPVNSTNNNGTNPVNSTNNSTKPVNSTSNNGTNPVNSTNNSTKPVNSTNNNGTKPGNSTSNNGTSPANSTNNSTKPVNSTNSTAPVTNNSSSSNNSTNTTKPANVTNSTGSAGNKKLLAKTTSANQTNGTNSTSNVTSSGNNSTNTTKPNNSTQNSTTPSNSTQNSTAPSNSTKPNNSTQNSTAPGNNTKPNNGTQNGNNQTNTTLSGQFNQATIDIVQRFSDLARQMTDQLPLLKGNFSGYQKSRTSCIVELINIQTSAWCLACDPDWQTKGVKADGSIQLSTDLCQRLTGACYDFISSSDEQNSILTVNYMSPMFDSLASAMDRIVKGDSLGADALNDAYSGVNLNPASPKSSAEVPASKPSGCTAEKCDFICSSFFVNGLIDQDTLAAGGEISSSTNSTSNSSSSSTKRLLEEVVEGKAVETLLKKGRNLVGSDSWNPDPKESGVAISFEDDPAQVNKFSANIIYNAVVCIGILLIALFI